MNQEINRKIVELKRFENSFPPRVAQPTFLGPVLGKMIKLIIYIFKLIINDIKAVEKKIEELEKLRK